jgi:two-component system sensor histidine kinase PilS (NtrC family)
MMAKTILTDLCNMTVSRDTAFESTPMSIPKEKAYPNRAAMAGFALFRLCVALGLVVVFVPSSAALWRAGGPISVSVWVSLIYALLVLFGTLLQYSKWPSKEHQVQVSVFLDIVTFTLLMQAGGGMRMGLGLLLAIAVAAGSLLMEGRLSLLFASFATLCVIAQQIHAQLVLDTAAGSITQAGLFGITFFTVALLGHVLYRRIQQTEELAARRQIDFHNLSELNDLIIQSMGIGVLVLDEEQRLRLINGAAVQLLGLSRIPKGERLQDVAPKLAQWLDARDEDSATQTRSRSVTARDQELRLTRRPLGEGAGAGMLLFLRDNRELAREAQQIKLASLGRLTASIAHNIRNPLSAISHAGQLLAESEALQAEDRHLLDIIRRNSRRIDETVESVLKLSRSDQANAEHIELGAWLGGFCTELREAQGLSEKQLRLVSPEETLSVDMDPRHLYQIMSNLCDNALRHAGTTDAQLRIEVRAHTDPVRGNPTVEVADNGSGIDQETAREIFSPFFSTRSSGIGLGLYIAKELSEANGAQLQYIAQENRGTRFRLSFPT